ncbi:MAG TPA: SprT-like domain-containing protein [Candidatus Aquicultor sp.]|jgi:hypothetical protein
MRDDQWLRDKLDTVWSEYFQDVPKTDNVIIHFSKKCRNRLGSIRLVNNTYSEIRINGHLKDKDIPDFVCEAVVAHELTHYVHGFGSSRPQLYRYPHRGGIVACEMIRRGLGEKHYAAKDWINTNWIGFYDEKNSSAVEES